MRREGALLALLATLLAVAYGCTLAPGLTWAHQGTDGGDLATAAAVLGVAHPTGYPTYVLLARLFQVLPVGEVAFRTNLLSAWCALLAALCVYGMVRALNSGSRGYHLAAAGLAALVCGLAPVFWSQAIITEVYSLNALFFGLLLLFAAQDEAAPGWSGRGQGFVAGLALGNHLTIGIAVVAWLTHSALAAPRGTRWVVVRQRFVWVGVGALIYLYLPLRAIAHPPINWGNPHTWEGFWWVVSAQPYRHLVSGLPPEMLSGRLLAWSGLLVQQFGVVGVVAGFIGLLYGELPCARARRVVWWLAGLAVAYSLFAITYHTGDSYAYLIPVYMIFATWIGMGVAALAKLAHRWQTYAPLAVAGTLAILLLWEVPATAASVDASDDSVAAAYAAEVFEVVPHGALILTSGDRDTFTLWYYHYAHAMRPDLFILAEPLLEYPWYRQHMRTVYPTLRLPEQRRKDWATTLRSANTSLEICRSSGDSQEAPIVCRL